MKLKEKSAISLIVLVITIIVLAILAGSVILTLSNTNIIGEASDAVQMTEAQQIEEAKQLMYADGMLGYNPEPRIIGDTELSWDATKKEVVEKLNGYVVIQGAVIPTKFYYVGGTKTTGVVISDEPDDENKGVDYKCAGNQFVWIPVDTYSKFVRGIARETSENSGIYKMTGTPKSTYVEPYSAGYATEASEYAAMCASVKKYGGFYIARFEAGDGDVDRERTGVTEAHKVVSKKDAIVYNCVPWGTEMNNIEPGTINGVENVAGAVYLSKNMYKNHESVESTLCYGVQWDAIMNYVSDADHNIADSRKWGNHVDSEGNANDNSGTLRTCGYSEYWKAKNIYDLAGNVYEWTMEAYTSGSNKRFSRGGAYYLSGDLGTASVHSDFDPTYTFYAGGFRVALYIKTSEI